ncbi:MAG: beta strand repeat-containing protein [Roseibacillus sp.]
MKLTRILLAGGLLVSLPLSAQTTYTYTGVSDNNAGSQWDVATNWDLGIAPGALLNGGGGIVLDDIVVLRNNEGNGTSQRIRMVLDAGTIDSLEIGGIGTAGSTGNTQLQLRSGVSVDVSGDVILGSVFGGGQRAGQINFANGNTTLSVAGNVVSGSTAGGNNININQGATSSFLLVGDIDSAAARAAIDGVEDHEIDLIVSRSEGVGLVGGVQELNVESFYVGSTGANVGSITQTIGIDKTVKALNGRVGSVNNNNRIASGTLHVDGGSVSYTNNLVVGRTQNQNSGNNDIAEATGNLLVGGLTNPGTVTVGGQLILAQQLGTTLGNGQSAFGNVIVDNPGSVLTVGGGLNMGATFDLGGTTMATFTVNEGTASIAGPITEDGTLEFTSTMTLNGGVLNFLDGMGGPRDVDTLNFAGGTMGFAVYGGMPTLDTDSTALAAAAGGSVIDVITAAAGTTFSTAEGSTWTGGGTGATPDGEWDSEVSDWDTGLPADGLGGIAMGEDFVVISSTLALTGDPAAAVLTPAATTAGWTLTQNANDLTLTAGSTIGGGVGKAIFDDPGADVTRTSDLKIEAAAGTGADATQIDITDVNSLTLTNLGIGGSAQATINQGTVGGGATGGMSVTVGGDLLFGNGGLEGGIYNLNEGTLSVTGDIVEGASGLPDGLVLNAQLQINTGAVGSQALTVDGSVTVQRFSVAQVDGSVAGLEISTASGLATVATTGTVAIGTGSNGSKDGDPLNVTGAIGTMIVGDGGTLNPTNMNIGDNGDSQGSLTIQNGGSVTSAQRIYVAGGQTNGNDSETVAGITMEPGSSLTVQTGNLDIGRGGAGTFTFNGGTYNQLANNVVIGRAVDARGTVTIAGGTFNVGDAANGDLNSDINILIGGGTLEQTGGDVTIERNLNMGNGENPSSYSISSGSLFVGRDYSSRVGDGQDDLKVSGDAVVILSRDLNLNGGTGVAVNSNLLEITGSAVTLDVGDDLLASNARATLRWVADASGVSAILVGFNPDDVPVGAPGPARINIAGAVLDIDLSAWAVPPAEIILIEAADATVLVLGTFTDASLVPLLEGDNVPSAPGYAISYILGPGGNDVGLLSGTSDPDSDMDGIPASVDNAANGLSDSDATDASSDNDGDGFTALFEYAMGTDVSDATSKPFWDVVHVSDTEVNITYGPIISGVTYNLNASADGVLFSQIDSFTAGADAPTNTFTDTTGGLDVELYQLEIPLPLP